MSKSKKNSTVDKYLSKNTMWKNETEKLRTIIINCGLTEELKWGKPCYLFEKNNIAIIQAFNEYFALGFFKGHLLKDNKKILVAPGENSQTMRQIRFKDVQEIKKLEPVVKAYINEAVRVENSGLNANVRRTIEPKLPEEFQNKLNKIPALKKAFYSLTPGRQRAYAIYFSSPKQSKTRESRIEKCKQQILDGKGLRD